MNPVPLTHQKTTLGQALRAQGLNVPTAGQRARAAAAGQILPTAREIAAGAVTPPPAATPGQSQPTYPLVYSPTLSAAAGTPTYSNVTKFSPTVRPAYVPSDEEQMFS